MTLDRKIFLKQDTKSINHKSSNILEHIEISIFGSSEDTKKKVKRKAKKIERKYLQHTINKGKHKE